MFVNFPVPKKITLFCKQNLKITDLSPPFSWEVYDGLALSKTLQLRQKFAFSPLLFNSRQSARASYILKTHIAEEEYTV
jgi:hypothetical protein